MKKKTVSTAAAAPGARRCPLCRSTGGTVIWRDKFCRVVIVRDRDYAGYCRVIWNSHVKEMTHLQNAQRAHCMCIVFAVEQAVREVLVPDKINLASFGNMAPHLHWHIIPRYAQDPHFPNPVWGRRTRTGNTKAATPAPANWRSALKRALAQIL